MAKSVLSKAQEFRFKEFELHGSLESWEDDLPIRLATYEYIKRDGAEVEPMGAGQKSFSFRCAFIGSDCGSRYRTLAASIQKEPRGQLVHPRLGTFNVACRGIKGRENPAQAIDSIEFTLDLIENQVDQSIQADQQFGAQRRASQVSDALTRATDATSAILSNRIANTVYAAATAAVVDLNSKADKFRSLALEVAQTSGEAADIAGYLALEKILGIVQAKTTVAVLALEDTLARTLESDVSLIDARTACYLTYAACVQLYAAVQAQFPPIVTFMVPSPMPLNSILLRIYGAEASGRRGQVYQLNRIPAPHWIPAGTILRVLAPKAVS